MSVSPSDPLDAALAKLKAAIVNFPQKQRKDIIEWVVSWSGYLTRERNFKPQNERRYYRGDIILVDFGFNVGHELGGEHFAAVIENNNNKSNGNIIIIPLTSLDPPVDPSAISPSLVYLGDNILIWTKKSTAAKPDQIRAISKMRILKHYQGRAQLEAEHLDLIDERLRNSILKK